MTREREIFLQALEQPIEARSDFVERATTGDSALKEAVEALLANNPMRDIRFSPDGKWVAVKTLKGLQLLDGSLPNEMKR